jgi:AraC-like DNA-binding protein
VEVNSSALLYKAQTLIKEGKKANEVGYLVGYNSPTQFSREYKRHFGFAPSATRWIWVCLFNSTKPY